MNAEAIEYRPDLAPAPRRQPVYIRRGGYWYVGRALALSSSEDGDPVALAYGAVGRGLTPALAWQDWQDQGADR
jgi:hypothetical protein